jgi:hypothetical protein
MLTIYRQLLRLYPAAHRQQFADEMLAVFVDVRADMAKKKFLAQTIFVMRELLGMVGGACSEHVRCLLGPDSGFPLPTRSLMIRNGFRFPKTTAVLMSLIFCGVVLAIKRGEEIATSLPHVNPPIVPIQPVHSMLLPSIAFFVIFFVAAGLLGWAILFALHRSGVHRLAQTSGEQK